MLFTLPSVPIRASRITVPFTPASRWSYRGFTSRSFVGGTMWPPVVDGVQAGGAGCA
jgi:hypothetical protein